MRNYLHTGSVPQFHTKSLSLKFTKIFNVVDNTLIQRHITVRRGTGFESHRHTHEFPIAGPKQAHKNVQTVA